MMLMVVIIYAINYIRAYRSRLIGFIDERGRNLLDIEAQLTGILDYAHSPSHYQPSELFNGSGTFLPAAIRLQAQFLQRVEQRSVLGVVDLLHGQGQRVGTLFLDCLDQSVHESRRRAHEHVPEISAGQQCVLVDVKQLVNVKRAGRCWMTNQAQTREVRDAGCDRA